MEELQAGELVEVGEIFTPDQDRFDHGSVVDELVELIREVTPPANVALFGPWGAGKSSVSNLLKSALDSAPDADFVRFDAFKYGEAPLRRAFLAKLASELNVTNSERYNQGLYRSETDTRINLRGRALIGLICAFFVVLTLTVALAIGLSALIAALSSGPFAPAFRNVVGKSLLAAIPIGAVLGLVGPLATKGLTVDRTRRAAEGAEEFEQLFKDLLEQFQRERGKGQRIVVFVDELDRCSPVEVAATLEALRTFLGVSPCIFIVAADQQVLEQALSEKVRQATPIDLANPYYSAGSSYLDKIFEFQFVLPSLKRQRITQYALDLVRDRPGVWQRVAALDDVVSVLVPSHVASPRRVKVLLNRFGLEYRIAERRVAKDRLDEGLPDRAVELAKLTALRCEFPLFAAELTLDPRLTELVRLVSEGLDLPATVSVEARQRAEAYASGRLPVALLLAREPGSVAHEGWAPETRSLAPSRPPVSPNGPSPEALDIDLSNDETTGDHHETPGEHDETPGEHDETTGEHDETTGEHDETTGDHGVKDDAEAVIEEVGGMVPRLQAVRRQHTLQLLRYLTRTAHVPGPRADLIHLESARATFDLRPEDVVRLEQAALDGVTSEVVGLIERLTDGTDYKREVGSRTLSRGSGGSSPDKAADAPRPVAVYRYLANIAESAVGVEADNVISSLLRAYLRFETDLRPHTDDILDAVRAQFDGVRNNSDCVAGAMLLGLSSRSATASALLELTVVAIENIGGPNNQLDEATIPRFTERLVSGADRLIPLNSEFFGSVMEVVLTKSSRAGHLLLELDPQWCQRAIELAAKDLSGTFGLAKVSDEYRNQTQAFAERGPSLEQTLRGARREPAAMLVHGLTDQAKDALAAPPPGDPDRTTAADSPRTG